MDTGCTDTAVKELCEACDMCDTQLVNRLKLTTIINELCYFYVQLNICTLCCFTFCSCIICPIYAKVNEHIICLRLKASYDNYDYIC